MTAREQRRSTRARPTESWLCAPACELDENSAAREVPRGLREKLAPCALWIHEGRACGLRCDGADELSVGRERLRPMWPGLFGWTPRNSVGRAAIRAMRDGVCVSRALNVEVIARRFSDPAEQLSFVRATVAAIEREQLLDPFRDRHLQWNATRAGALSPDALFDALAHDAPALLAALTAVRAQPATALVSEVERVVVARDPTALDAMDVASASGPWQQTASASASSRLRGRAPREAWGAVPKSSYDCAENRWLRASLCALIEHTESASFATVRRQRSPHERSAVAQALREIQEAIEREPLSDAVAAVSDPARARAMCERRESYASVLRWLESAGAECTLRWPNAREAASLRDAATLYEMYCFFALARAIAAALSEPLRFAPARDARDAPQGVARGAEARIGEAHTLLYNRSVEAYSGALRPDFALFRGDALQLVFDAKMRVRDGCARDQGEDEAARVDLDKMHAYRDALSARAAVCLFPGERSVLYETDGRRREGARIATIVRGNMQGIGAIALVPEGAL